MRIKQAPSKSTETDQKRGLTKGTLTDPAISSYHYLECLNTPREEVFQVSLDHAEQEPCWMHTELFSMMLSANFLHMQ